MSHQPERKAKDCLNCGTLVHGRFCHVCGQENIVTHQNFTGLAKHFIYDIFHFDGKFFDTLKHLLLKPGFVAKQYVIGKRASHLDPIRMYLFVSALFFLIFFSFAKPELEEKTGDEVYLSTSERFRVADSLKIKLKSSPLDTTLTKKIALLLDTTKTVTLSDLKATLPGITIENVRYTSVRNYDSLQKLLPKSQRNNWFKRRVYTKLIGINTKYKNNWKEGSRNFYEGFLHRMPYLLFLSLPFFALILKLIYIRRKNFFYSDHAVFTLYHYIFSFLILLLVIGFNKLLDWLQWDVFGWIIAGLVFYWFIYLYKSMRNFYGQSRAKTIGKFLILNLLGFFTLILLFLIFIFFSIFQL